MAENEENTATLLGEIEQGPSKFDLFLDKNQKNLLIVGIILVLLVAGYIIMKGMQKNKGLDSSAAFISADSVEDYTDVANNYSGTPAGGSALLALANAQWEKDQKDDAISTLKNFVDQYSDHKAYPATLVNLSSKLTATDKVSEATTYLEEVVDLQDASFSPIANYLLAEQKLVSGDQAGAIAKLEQLMKLSDEELGDLKPLVERGLDFSKSPRPEVVAAPVIPVTPEESPASTDATPAELPLIDSPVIQEDITIEEKVIEE